MNTAGTEEFINEEANGNHLQISESASMYAESSPAKSEDSRSIAELKKFLNVKAKKVNDNKSSHCSNATNEMATSIRQIIRSRISSPPTQLTPSRQSARIAKLVGKDKK